MSLDATRGANGGIACGSPHFLDGLNYSYTPEDYTPMKTLDISIFNGKDWDISDKPVTE